MSCGLPSLPTKYSSMARVSEVLGYFLQFLVHGCCANITACDDSMKEDELAPLSEASPFVGFQPSIETSSPSSRVSASTICKGRIEGALSRVVSDSTREHFAGHGDQATAAVMKSNILFLDGFAPQLCDASIHLANIRPTLPVIVLCSVKPVKATTRS